MIIADRYPSLVRADVIHPIRDRFGDIRVRKSWTSTLVGRPLGCHSRPPLALVPLTSSFFLQSTEITGSPAAMNSPATRLMCSNWALRSGC